MAATPKNQLFDPGFLFAPSDSFKLSRTVSPQCKTSQTTDDRQTTHCAKGATDSTVGQKRCQNGYLNTACYLISYLWRHKDKTVQISNGNDTDWCWCSVNCHILDKFRQCMCCRVSVNSFVDWMLYGHFCGSKNYSSNRCSLSRFALLSVFRLKTSSLTFLCFIRVINYMDVLSVFISSHRQLYLQAVLEAGYSYAHMSMM